MFLQHQQRHLFYNQQFSVESWSSENENGRMAGPDPRVGPGGGGSGSGRGPGGGVPHPTAAAPGAPSGEDSGLLPRRHSSSLSATSDSISDADDVFNVTLNTTDGTDAEDDNLHVDNNSAAAGSQHAPQQVTTYHIDKAKQHPMNAEHANKNGYVKMGDNGVIAMFTKNPVPSLPKVDEEE